MVENYTQSENIPYSTHVFPTVILAKSYWEAVRLWNRGIEMNTEDLCSFWCMSQSHFPALLAAGGWRDVD